MMATNLFVIANAKQLRTKVVLEFYCLFFRTSWGVGVLNSAIFNNFGGLSEFRRGVFEPPPNPPRYATL